ncbi:hypothetical protein BJX68DRAFT_245585 [Aspergillus pseudodeflectus]|uniref:Uncharacterized protein n=1 Tax=Aspergillus pseudodeflectus TaxID=176178 RepID=A0ABR4JNZ6_9EURO
METSRDLDPALTFGFWLFASQCANSSFSSIISFPNDHLNLIKPSKTVLTMSETAPSEAATVLRTKLLNIPSETRALEAARVQLHEQILSADDHKPSQSKSTQTLRAE